MPRVEPVQPSRPSPAVWVRRLDARRRDSVAIGQKADRARDEATRKALEVERPVRRGGLDVLA